MTPRFLPLRADSGLKASAAAWFHAKWGVPESAYTGDRPMVKSRNSDELNPSANAPGR